jgi:hypothetical protein
VPQQAMQRGQVASLRLGTQRLPRVRTPKLNVNRP